MEKREDNIFITRARNIKPLIQSSVNCECYVVCIKTEVSTKKVTTYRRFLNENYLWWNINTTIVSLRVMSFACRFFGFVVFTSGCSHTRRGYYNPVGIGVNKWKYETQQRKNDNNNLLFFALCYEKPTKTQAHTDKQRERISSLRTMI